VLCSLLWKRYKLTVIQPAQLRYYGNAIKLIVTQHTEQELLRYYGNLICHSMYASIGIDEGNENVHVRLQEIFSMP
jgi:hypothetical protein